MKNSAGLMRPGRKTRRKNCWLALSVETHVYRLGLLRPYRRSRKTDGAFVVDEEERGDCWGWPRLVRVSVSSTNTCPPPKAEAYSASTTDATTTGMRWQWAWRGALWATEVGKVKEGLD